MPKQLLHDDDDDNDGDDDDYVDGDGDDDDLNRTTQFRNNKQYSPYFLQIMIPFVTTISVDAIN